MSEPSAGIMLFRRAEQGIEVLLVHPGGPFWKNKDLGTWSIPKGLPNAGEDHLAAARREFEEETGSPCPGGETIDLGEVRLKSGKRVRAWAVEGDIDTTQCRSNCFAVEWPPKSGRLKDFPEVDQWQFFPATEAKVKLNQSQGPLVDRLLEKLGRNDPQ